MTKTKIKNVGMVDISKKKIARRKATAVAKIILTKETYDALIKKKSMKGDVLETSRIAGIMAAKNTPNIIPMCHPIELEKVSINFKLQKRNKQIDIISDVFANAKTGVEMEALVAASAAALTVYDMLKAFGKGMIISDTRLLYKSGGKSGIYDATK